MSNLLKAKIFCQIIIGLICLLFLARPVFSFASTTQIELKMSPSPPTSDEDSSSDEGDKTSSSESDEDITSEQEEATLPSVPAEDSTSKQEQEEKTSLSLKPSSDTLSKPEAKESRNGPSVPILAAGGVLLFTILACIIYGRRKIV